MTGVASERKVLRDVVTPTGRDVVARVRCERFCARGQRRDRPSVSGGVCGREEYVSQAADAGGRHFESNPDRTSQRYGLAITSAYILERAFRDRGGSVR